MIAKKMNIIAKYIHGSENSLDVDIHYVVDKLPDLAECKRFCSENKNENRNLIIIKEGCVADTYKGSPDEVNNGLIETYKCHDQTCDLLVTEHMDRVVSLKLVTGIRSILSHVSRSKYRSAVKTALKGTWTQKLACLKVIDLSKIDFDSLNNNMTGKDIKKVLSFQIGQIMGLLDGVELYTKSGISEYMPGLKPYLMREDCDIEGLSDAYAEFVATVTDIGYMEDDNVVIFPLLDGIPINMKTEKLLA